MKKRYLGLLGLPMMMVQCQPACTPAPPPVETTTTTALPDTTSTTSTTQPAAGGTIDYLFEAGDNCLSLTIINTGDVPLRWERTLGTAPRTVDLAPGEYISEPFENSGNGYDGVVGSLTTLADGTFEGAATPAGTVIDDGLHTAAEFLCV